MIPKEEKKIISFILTEEYKISRLDQLLAIKFPDRSRNYFQHVIENGNVFINQKLGAKKDRVHKGDLITLYLQPKQPLKAIPENIPLHILYEDAHLLAVNKPSGMVVHPGAGNPSKTLVNALLYHISHLSSGSDPLRPGIVHRLDKETSGVLLVAKNEMAHIAITQLFAKKLVQKKYLAVCESSPQKTGLISLPIARHPINRKKMIVSPSGKESVTKIMILSKKEGLTLVAVYPVTGRTHQIRTHLKFLYAPIVGDKIYGNHCKDYPYMFLHAHTITFRHPVSSKLVCIKAPLEVKFLEWANNFFA